MSQMSIAATDQYPRTLFEWLKKDDKLLLAAIKNGQSVFEVAEDLQREHVAVINHLNTLGLFEFETHTEEWAEVMALALAGAPLGTTLDWCTCAPTRLPFDEIESLTLGGTLRPEFELAREHHIFVPNSTALADLNWLASQPPAAQARYPRACTELANAFEIITPLSLKNQILGLKTPALAKNWLSTSTPAPARGRTKTYRRRKSSTTASTRTYRKHYSTAKRSKTRAF